MFERRDVPYTGRRQWASFAGLLFGPLASNIVSHATELLRTAITVVAMAFGLGVVLYVLCSFALTGSHTARRPVGISVREMLREIALALATQPFLPLFYVVGRQMRVPRVLGARTAGAEARPSIPVVFVHGYMQNRVDFVGLAYALARRGRGPLYGFNYPWLDALGPNAERLARFIEGVGRETGAREVDLVCHSMGGLVALEMLRTRKVPTGGEPLAPVRVRRCVTIATPHAGVMWRGPIFGAGGRSLRRGSEVLSAHATMTADVPLLSVYSSHDNVVHPKETSSLAHRGGRDVLVVGPAHLAILFSKEVAAHVAGFLSADEPPADVIVDRAAR